MKGVSEHHRREAGVNLTAGKVNSIELTQKIMGAPRMDDMLLAFMSHIGMAEPTLDQAISFTKAAEEKKIVPVEAA